jgi:hypothetical protein
VGRARKGHQSPAFGGAFLWCLFCADGHGYRARGPIVGKFYRQVGGEAYLMMAQRHSVKIKKHLKSNS